jgi:Na+-transporting methylmalonyl-CoA/oxaloacetate decarboxylase gamma subunit
MIDSLSIGLQLTVWGMGLVFLLLAALWGLMTLMLRLDRAPDLADQNLAETITSQSPEIEADKLAAITIAVMMHRRVRRKQAAPALRAHRPGTLPSRWVGAGRARQNQTWQPKR